MNRRPGDMLTTAIKLSPWDMYLYPRPYGDGDEIKHLGYDERVDLISVPPGSIVLVVASIGNTSAERLLLLTSCGLGWSFATNWKPT